MSVISPYLTSPQLTSFHLNWVHCDWSQLRRIRSLHSTQTSLRWLQPITAHSVKMNRGKMRWDAMSDMNIHSFSHVCWCCRCVKLSTIFCLYMLLLVDDLLLPSNRWHLSIDDCLKVMRVDYQNCFLPSVLWRCWLGGRKGIWPVKKWVVGWWHGYLGWGADLHMAGQMPLPLTNSCSSKSRLV